MNARTLTLILTAAITLFAQADVALQKAIRKETLEGDPKGAIGLYYKAISEAKNDRALTAKALIRMADCYQKLGDTESRRIYERILREYADQRGPADEARARMAALRPPPSVNTNTGIVNKRIWMVPDRGDIFGTVSPDGRYVPYVAWAQNGDLFMHDLIAGTDRRLTNEANDGKPGIGKSQEQYAEEYAFSKDGKQLVYSWLNGERYELRVVQLQGTGVPSYRKLFDNEDVDWIGPHDWSPDGKWIAVQLHRKDRSAQLGLISAQDGSLRVLKSVDWRGAGGMFFSSDGMYVAYDLPVSEESQQRDVFLMAVDASRESTVVAHPAQDAVLGWSPDGKRLLFASDRSGSMSLWAISISGGQPDGMAELVKRDIGDIGNMGMTTSGVLYYFSHKPLGADIYVGTFDFAKGDFLSPPDQAVQTYVGTNQSPDWSRDGKYLAYFSTRTAIGSRYFVIGIRSVEPGQVREIVPFPNFNLFWSLSWSHDSKSLLVGGRDSKGRDGIFRVDAKTGRSSLVMEGWRAARAAVESPDGKSLYYPAKVKDGQEVAYIKRDLVSGEETVLLEASRLDRSANLSADGLYLAVHEIGSSGAPQAVILLPTTGGPPREMIRFQGPQRGSFFAWTPDGQAMLIRKFIAPGNVEQWRIPLNGEEPTKLEAPARFPSAGFRVHPNGRLVAFPVATPRRPFEIWVLENFLPTSTASR